MNMEEAAMATNQDQGKHVPSVDALVICDDKDHELLDSNVSLQKAIHKADINVTYVYEGKEPQISLWKQIELMLQSSKCVILYITEHFCKNEYMSYTTEPLSEKVLNGKLFVLSTFPCKMVKKEFHWLAKCPIISETAQGWESKLVQLVKSESIQYPSFCKPILPVRDIIMCNLGQDCLSRLKRDKLGVILEVGKQIVEVDLHAFESYIKGHRNVYENDHCKDCSSLCSINTSISIMVDEDKESEHFYSTLENTDALSWLAFFVLDVRGALSMNTDWILGYTVQGQKLKDDRILKKVVSVIYKFLIEKNSAYTNINLFPEFTDEKRRMESFQDRRLQEDLVKLVDAGFYFSESRMQSQCFQCGLTIHTWNENDDPYLRHAALRPYCPYIKAKLSAEKIEAAKVLTDRESKVWRFVYNSEEARRKSFSNLDFRHIKDFETSQKCKGDFITELVDAGFFFHGSVDLVECFCCGLRVSSLRPEENPSITHAKLSPNCQYIEEKLGKTLIERYFNASSIENYEKYTEITIMLRTLDRDPRRDWPHNIISPT